ncbi:MAG: PAS domain-containing protein [Bacteroidota bacterium]|nr:PAS domain-containing protein [Bacteroidota bacterium]
MEDNNLDWLKEINAAVTICDAQGIIVYMNEKSAQVFDSDGGKQLLGKSLFDCHPETALTKLKELLSSGKTNVYTIEKNGKKKIIYQSPWSDGKLIGGIIEISIELPAEMNHFIRK